MVKKVGTCRSKTRLLYKKSLRAKGKISTKHYFSIYKDGERVGLACEPAIQKGLYHPRFYGRSGLVSGKRGRCYLVDIKDGGKSKTLIVHPVHLRRMEK